MKTYKIQHSASMILACVLVIIFSLTLSKQQLFAAQSSSWNPTLLVNTESFQRIDGGDASTTIDLEFGASTSTLKLLTSGAFQFNRSLSVLGTISGSALRVDHNADINGTLSVSGAIRTESSVSGAYLTFMGATSSYILGNLGIGKSGTINTKLEVLGTISGTTVNANSLLTGSTLQGFGLYNCQGTSNKITYDATTKKFLCEADQTGGSSGGGNWSNTGALRAAFDLRYVNVSGDTMTGALKIQNGNTGAPTTQMLLNVLGAISGNRLGLANSDHTSTGALYVAQYASATGAMIRNLHSTARPVLALDSRGLSGTAAHLIFGYKGTYDTTLFRSGISTLRTDGAFVAKTVVSGAYLTFMGATNSYILGSLGVGTNAPSTKLEVQGNGGDSSTLLVSAVGAQKNAFIKLKDSDSGNTWDLQGLYDGFFSIANSGARRFTIDTTGNVGINTIDPSQKLEVLGTISGTTLNAHTLLTGATLQGFGLYNCQGTSNKITYDSTTKKFLCEADQTGGSSGGGMSYDTASGIFLKRSGGTMTGGLMIQVTTGDIVKSTSGSSLATDFAKAGATLSNVSSRKDILDMDPGAIPSAGQGTMASSSIVVGAAVGAGAHSIVRSDGRIVIIRGNAANSAYVWDGLAPTMGATLTNPLSSGTVGAGAMSVRRADGRYIVFAGGATTTTGLFDPYGAVATSAGPAICTTGATTGTNAALIGSGVYLVLCGNTTNWGLLNANSSVYVAGAALGATFGAGAHTVQLDDGRFLVFAGGNTSSHWIFNPNLPLVQSWSVINPISSPPTVTTGGFSYRRSDGKFVIVGGAVDASTVYDPTPTSSANFGTFTAQSGAGYGPRTALADGAGAVYRQDGKLLLMIGGAVTTNIIDRSRTDGGQFVSGPNITGGTPGAGAHMVMNARGRYQIIIGGATTTTTTYDMGYIIGGNRTATATGSLYETECITVNTIHSGATLTWNTNAEDQRMVFMVRTGNGSCPTAETSYKIIADKGGLIRPTSGDNRVQIKVLFARGAPVQADQDWGLRRGLSQPFYRAIVKNPALYDITLRNSASLHRTQFDFGASNDSSGPLAINIANDKNRSMQIQLANTFSYGSTYNTASAGAQILNGGIGGFRPLTTTSTVGTVVLRKPSGTYVIIAGNGTANAQLLDTNTGGIVALGTTPTSYTGTGAFAFKRPDGKFVIGMGHNSKITNIYDPLANTFTAGPDLVDRVGEGSMVIPLANGRVLIIHGGFRRTSSIYDPFLNVAYSGATTISNIGRGAMAIPKPDGQYLIVPGTTTQGCTTNTATHLFDPLTNGFRPNPGVAFTTTGTGPGAVAVELQSGNWMIFKGGATTNTCATVTASTIYNPFQNRIAAGPTVTAQRYGSVATQRPDGRWIIFNANALATTQIYNEQTSTFGTGIGSGIGEVIVGPTTPTNIGTGAVVVQLDNGKYFVVAGANAVASAGTTSTMLADFGWVSDGYYRSEVMRVPDLDSTSTLTWHQSPAFGGVSAHVRTGTSALMMSVQSDREVPYSGGPISPETGEQYVQVNFALKRTVPPLPGIMEDVWYNGGTVPPYRYRKIDSPTITDYSIGKDVDLINMKADQTSLFRVNSNGDVYTGTKGALYSGGADLAERYISKDDLEAGELVTFDYFNDHSVRRSTKKYQSELLGVVSTNPGFIAGAYTKNSFPIALVGRVPVKVSLENGSVTAGDRLTASSTPGYAMRATKAGRVIGVALESTKSDFIVPCPKEPKKQCTTLMMFVNLSDWPGYSAE